MAINTAQTQTFTDAELLALYRQALAQIALGQSYDINGRSLTRANLQQVREMIEWLETRTNSSDVDGGIALVQYEDRS